MEKIQYIYTITSIFGLGIVFIDLLFMGNSDDNGGSEGADGSDGDLGSDGDTGADADTAEALDADAEPDSHGSILADKTKTFGSTIVELLSLLRSTVYFSLGFGVTGWAALFQGQSILTSLFWSIPSGIFSVIVLKVINRFQRTELNSQFTSQDLINKKGKTLTLFNENEIGKVQIFTADISVERYAKEASGKPLAKGTSIIVLKADDEFLYISEMEESK